MIQADDSFGNGGGAATALDPPFKDTKDRILDSAEFLFAQRGFEATSLRRITSRAGVNLAAVNYHFRTKEQLILAVMLRKLEPINQRRVELLDELEAGSGSGGPSLEQVLSCFLKPVVEAREAGVQLDSFPILMGRLYVAPGGLFQKLWGVAFADIARRFKLALARALPGADGMDILWGMHLTVGAMAHFLAKPPVLTLLAGAQPGEESRENAQEALERLVAYMAGGFRALVERKEHP